MDTSAYQDTSVVFYYWSGVSFNAPIHPMINDSTLLYYYQYVPDRFVIPSEELIHVAFARMAGNILNTR